MGTWGTKTFENDDAMDWLAELREGGNIAFLTSSLSPTGLEGDYLEATEGARILCSAEVIAAAVSGNTEALPEEAVSWLRASHDPDFSALVPLARARVSRVLDEHSELRELWVENSAEFPTWRDSVTQLLARLVLPPNPSNAS